MGLAITAEFPLGFYQGRDRFGATERYPHFSRTYSAIVGGAYALARLEHDESTSPHPEDVASAAAVNTALSADDQAALEWLEQHAPDAITLPDVPDNLNSRARSFRRKGWGQLAQAGSPDLPAAAERAIARTPLSGPITWWWKDTPPETIAQRIAAFSGEVPYLGEASSPVRLSSGILDAVPAEAWHRDDDAIDAPGAYAFDLPAPGRADTLQDAFSALAETKEPTTAQDRARASANAESDRSDPWPSKGLRQQVLYVPPAHAAVSTDPWAYGYVLHVRPLQPDRRQYWRPDVADRVGWAVAVHRALVKQLGADAGGLITGRYAPGEIPPANRLTIQILDAGMPLASELDGAVGRGRTEHAVIFVAVPSLTNGSTPDDLEQIETALSALRRIALRSDQVVEVTDITPADATAVWAKPEEGVQRWWFPHPLVIAESRPPARSKRQDREWTAGDALRVSIGNVFRNRPELRTSARGDRRLVELSGLVHSAGVRIGSPRRAYPSQIGKYVHHTNTEAVLTALQGLIYLGPFTGGQALIALGQSRHFGGGLLVPFDLPSIPEAAPVSSGASAFASPPVSSLTESSAPVRVGSPTYQEQQ